MSEHNARMYTLPHMYYSHFTQTDRGLVRHRRLRYLWGRELENYDNLRFHLGIDPGDDRARPVGNRRA